MWIYLGGKQSFPAQAIHFVTKTCFCLRIRRILEKKVALGGGGGVTLGDLLAVKPENPQQEIRGLNRKYEGVYLEPPSRSLGFRVAVVPLSCSFCH